MRYRRRLQHPGRESRHRRIGEDLLLRLLSRYDRKGGLRLVRLWGAWEQVVGPELAALARPLGHREGTLILEAQDAVTAQELSFYAPELLERINAFFGEEVFDKVRFELLDGRVPLGRHEPEAPASAPRAPQRPGELGSLAAVLDPESAVGRTYAAYVRRFAAQGGSAPQTDANTRPQRASRRRK